MANMKRTKFYFCGKCGNIIASTNNVILNCCGQKLTELKAKELKNNKNGEKSVDKDGNLTRNAFPPSSSFKFSFLHNLEDIH